MEYTRTTCREKQTIGDSKVDIYFSLYLITDVSGGAGHHPITSLCTAAAQIVPHCAAVLLQSPPHCSKLAPRNPSLQQNCSKKPLTAAELLQETPHCSRIAPRNPSLQQNCYNKPLTVANLLQYTSHCSRLAPIKPQMQQTCSNHLIIEADLLHSVPHHSRLVLITLSQKQTCSPPPSQQQLSQLWPSCALLVHHCAGMQAPSPSSPGL